MGVKHFGNGSKIIVTSRDRQVLRNVGASDDNIHKVEKLNEEDSLQLFSTFAFQQLNPDADFLHLSHEFLQYADGSPLALKITGSTLYSKPREVWESEVHKLKQYAKPRISEILKISFDGLDELEKKLFLDIACFFKGESKKGVEKILSTLYVGAMSGINTLLDKCLLDIDSEEYVSMHDMLEEMGKDIVCQESKYPGECSRLWIPKDVYQVLKYNKGTELIEGMKLDMSQIDNMQLCPSVFKNMINLRFIHFYGLWCKWNPKLLANGVDIDYLSNELRGLWWEFYPFKSLPPSFNAKNLGVLKLPCGDMEQLWNEDDHMDLVNLMVIDVSQCKNLRKIPNLSGAINLKSLDCTGCESLVELTCLNHLASLETLRIFGCLNLRRIPDLLGAINLKWISCNWCDSLVELPCLSHLTFLEGLFLAGCYMVKKFPELPNNLSVLDISSTDIEEVPDSIEHLLELKSLILSNSKVKKISSNISKLESLQRLDVSVCKGLKSLPELPPYLCCLKAKCCASLERVEFTNLNSLQSDYLDNKYVLLSFWNCLGLNQDSVKNIETNAMLQIQYLAQRLARDVIYHRKSRFDGFICLFPGNEISANEFEHRGTESRLNLKIAPNGRSGSRFLAFAICLVIDHTHLLDLEFNCKFLLTASSGEEFRSESVLSNHESMTLSSDESDHVFILFGEDMIVKDNDYEEASLDFNIIGHSLGERNVVKVKECGVHAFHVDAESCVVSSPTKMKNFSYIGGEGGERGAKRLKFFHFI